MQSDSNICRNVAVVCIKWTIVMWFAETMSKLYCWDVKILFVTPDFMSGTQTSQSFELPAFQSYFVLKWSQRYFTKVLLFVLMFILFTDIFTSMTVIFKKN